MRSDDPRAREGAMSPLLSKEKGRARRGMKKTERSKIGKASAPVDPDEILPEYDFSHGRPNKFASRYVEGSTVIVLEPDVAAAFPTAGAANAALRVLPGLIQKHRTPKVGPRRSV